MKVMHVEDNTCKLFPIRNSINVYLRIHKNWGDDYVTVIPDEGYLCDTTIPNNYYFSTKIIPTITYSVPPSFHIGCTKKYLLKKSIYCHKHHHPHPCVYPKYQTWYLDINSWSHPWLKSTLSKAQANFRRGMLPWIWLTHGRYTTVCTFYSTITENSQWLSHYLRVSIPCPTAEAKLESIK